jgi:serine protease Do
MFIRIFSAVLALFAVAAAPAPAAETAIPESRAEVQLSFAPVVKAVAPAVVNIYTKRTVSKRIRSPFFNDPLFAPLFGGNAGPMRQQVENSLGSGVIVEPDGLVVTNTHVIRGAEEITVVLADGREFDATLALEDDSSDLALLRVVSPAQGLPYVSLKPSESLQVGDLVLAIGNPFGVGQTVTSGIVSAQGRSSLDINDFNFFIQTDAAINPGNSGGPLVALDGGVVGINTAIYSRDGGSLGIGFAIPSEMVASVIAAEKSGSKGGAGVVRPWLGVTAQIVTADIANSLDLDRPAGALISDLHQASPLKKAGLQVGDVVLSMNGKPVRDPSEMKFRMATVPLGQQTGVEAVRKGKRLSFKVAAMAPPDEPPANEMTLGEEYILSGATIANLNPAVAVRIGMAAEDATGVAVVAVKPGSRAARLVQAADILLEINGREIKDVKDVEKALKAAPRSFSMVANNHGRKRRIVIR